MKHVVSQAHWLTLLLQDSIVFGVIDDRNLATNGVAANINHCEMLCHGQPHIIIGIVRRAEEAVFMLNFDEILGNHRAAENNRTLNSHIARISSIAQGAEKKSFALRAARFDSNFITIPPSGNARVTRPNLLMRYS
ncbi:MAG TPA: hypothetical protein VNT76_06490 [Candidatus Binatus sp.]|nr:hypothetical protein [Candidatus Binatus sp.]